MSSSVIDKATLDNLVAATDEEFVAELIETFLEDSPELIAQLKRSHSENDSPTFQRAAHTLKSNSASFGAMHLSELAKELEMMGKSSDLSQGLEKITALEDEYALVETELKAR
jgi:HPt (histidine-containing phosphotransfer) domain-containing protein